jgi:hypothetical protein
MKFLKFPLIKSCISCTIPKTYFSRQLLDPGGGAGLDFVQPLNQLDELFAPVIFQLVFIARQDGLEDGKKGRGELADGSVFPFI